MILATMQCGPENECLLPTDERQSLLREIPGWSMQEKEIEGEFSFADFSEVMGFANAVARLAEAQGHHPDLSLSYKNIRVRLSTHKAGGLSRNDFILAAKINRVMEKIASSDSRPELPGRSLKSMTMLITGAARRIGREIAMALADEGANVVVHYRNSGQEAEALCSELRERGVGAWPLQADFDNGSNAARIIGRAKELAGKLDGIINSAASFTTQTIENLGLADLTDHMVVNAWVPLILSREFFRVERKGNIITILDSRISGYDWSHVGYIMSKHALALLTGMMALEFAPDARVNAVAPGWILPPPGENLDYLERQTKTVPLKRHGDPRDIARAVVFLLKNRYITGQVLYVDGGQHLEGGRAWTA
jgi:NAD(P)-dependent dehydrogenase (short-subunit alcohol dehydrogenase family)/pterin-4a-carbinolamine dehydratase